MFEFLWGNSLLKLEAKSVGKDEVGLLFGG